MKMKKMSYSTVAFVFAMGCSVLVYQNCAPAKFDTNENQRKTLTNSYHWIPGVWGKCASGKQNRTYQCYNAGTGKNVDDSQCPAESLTTARDCTSSEYKTYIKDTPSSISKVDILLIIDDSNSMLEEQNKLAERFGDFAEDLSQSGLDWQACYTTTDMYYKGWPLNWENSDGTILKPSDANYKQIFKDTISAIGAGYSDDEQGIKAAHLAVEKNGTHKCFRDGAALSFIVISDEDERSVGGNSRLSNVQYVALETKNTPQALVAAVKNNLGSEKIFNFNSIIARDETCEAAQSRQASPSFIGYRYMELSELTDGYIGDICSSDYTENLKFFQEKIEYALSEIELECVAKSEGLTVQVIPSLSGFTYKQDGKKMRFAPRIPANHRVIVNYACQ